MVSGKQMYIVPEQVYARMRGWITWVAHHVKTACRMQALYSSVNASMVSKPGAAEAELEGGATVSNVTTVKGTSCVFPFTYQDAAYTTCMAPQGSGSR